MNGYLYKWSLWCETCDCERRTDYIPSSNGQPTVCPYNHDHTNIRDQAIVGSINLSAQPVKKIDVDNLDPAKARAKVVGISFEAAPNSWTKKQVSFPYPTNILSGEGYGGFAEDGDEAEFSLDPTLIGIVAAPAAQTATEIYVGLPEEAWDALMLGMWLQFGRGGAQAPDSEHPGDDEYLISGIDKENSKITLNSGLETALSANDTVFLVVKYGEDIELQMGENINVGGAAEGAAPLDANQVFNMWYFNVNDMEAKQVRLRLNLKYGPLAGQ